MHNTDIERQLANDVDDDNRIWWQIEGQNSNGHRQTQKQAVDEEVVDVDDDDDSDYYEEKEDEEELSLVKWIIIVITSLKVSPLKFWMR